MRSESTRMLRTHRSTRAGRSFALLLVTTLAGCGDEHIVNQGRPTLPPQSESELLIELERTFNSRDIDALEILFHPEFTYHEVADDVIWMCRDRWLCQHRNVFDPQSAQPPLPPEYAVGTLDFTATPISGFVERPEYYSLQGQPEGLDPQRWRISAAEVDVRLSFELAGDTDYVARQRSNFVVVEGRSKSTGEAGKYAFYSIELVSVLRKSVIPPTWGVLVSAFGGQCDECSTPSVVSHVVDALAQAYATQDLQNFASLLHPDFAFWPGPIPNRPWGRAYEVRAHRRMFRPDDLAPGDIPVPAALRVRNVDISLEILRSSLASEPGTLPTLATATLLPRRMWIVRTRADVLVRTLGPIDYQIASIQELALAPIPEAPNSLRIFSWYESTTPAGLDLSGRSEHGVEAISWRALRRLYDGN